ncbi:MAG TPA: hypothetical protein VHU17_17810 [Acidimicrobiales bacterium]|nr:hypothetical protein [Acidimicrobiales bacterium]
MYVEILTSVLRDNEDPAQCGLLEDALRCRIRMGSERSGGASSVRNALAFEVAYDLSLIKLCASKGISVAPARFDHPEAERARLEEQLATMGVDLAALAQRRTQGD